MDPFYWAILGGLVGTVMMDITERIAGKLNVVGSIPITRSFV